MDANNYYDAIIIGAGPAGLTAGIYLSRAHIKTLIINEGTIGGQMIFTHEIANYPGLESVSGYQLANTMKKQAKMFGCNIKSNVSIKDVNLNDELKKVVLSDGNIYNSKTIIIASGGRPRSLNAIGEALFKGKGISYCATCDGDFFTNKDIIVVGGGNSALEEAISLTKYVNKITILHQFNHFQAFQHAINEVKNHPKINFMMGSTINEFIGNEKLEKVRVTNLKTGESNYLKIDGVFIFIGYIPNTEFLKGKIDLNEFGEIIVGPGMNTNIKGVYAAGDSIVKLFRQITTAVGDGTIAALSASDYLHKQNAKQ
ncbi:MAG: pyridine nucleotide-disulfide oxidoreductase [Bacteroidetes bacterium GWE2_29_8]|nr:MAG: pyridine nucleotide-disulfide oxidoreductase [Bacteroidetes bacterium GWE2_29_8]OFY17395.1 MAG: pyridine nucleotide-disulfide oxidoreductase [Bacteroidetes bacterium GWF2_29_10]